MRTLIVGYGYIGKHLANELARVKPDIYDKYLKVDTRQHEQYDIAWLCLPTPYDTCEIDELLHAMKDQEAAIYVIKSTILPHRIEELRKLTSKRIVICPEFYGKSKDSIDFKQDYTILGGDKADCEKVIDSIQFCYNGNHRFITTSPTLASLVKYMSNSYLLLKQTFCNEFYQIAQSFGVSYHELRELFILDQRFTGVRTQVDKSTLHLNHHCLSKDVPAIAKEADNDFLQFLCSYHHITKKGDAE